MSLSLRKVVVSALAAAIGLLVCPAQADYVTVVTGGEVTSAGGGADAVHTFRIGTESKTLTVEFPVFAQVLIVGGGAGSAGYGGGGAGGRGGSGCIILRYRTGGFMLWVR